MIKRRHYRYEHGSKDAASESSSSSSSESEVEAEATDDSEEEQDDDEVEEEVNAATTEAREKEDASSSSGYESEDSSVNEVNLDSSGLPTSDEELAAERDAQNIVGKLTSGKGDAILSRMQHNSPQKDAMKLDDEACYVLKRNSVFKCRVCPRIVCLSEETLKAHLSSKRHARSKKLLQEGRLKLMLNDNGQIEGETEPEKHDTTDSEEEAFSKPKVFSKPKRKVKPGWKPKRKLRQKGTMLEAKRPPQNREKRRKKDS